jgi:membrane protease YdiL (CAAX protease family)
VSSREHASLPLLGAAALLILTMVLMFALGQGAAAIHAYAHGVPLADAERHLSGDLLSLTLVQLAAMATAIFLGLRLTGSEAGVLETLQLEPVPSRVLALCLAAGICLQFPLTELSNVLHNYVFGPDPIEQQLALQNLLDARNLGQGLLVIGSIAGLIPLAEELLFRGLFTFGLARRYGAPSAIVVSAALFGVVHFGYVPSIYASVAGLILGWLALTTRSVWPGVALHGAFNAVPVLLPARAVPIRGFNIPSTSPDHLPAWLVWIPLLVGVLLLGLVRQDAQRPAP